MRAGREYKEIFKLRWQKELLYRSKFLKKYKNKLLRNINISLQCLINYLSRIGSQTEIKNLIHV